MSIDDMKQGWTLNSWLISIGTIILAAALCWFGKASMDTRDLLNQKLPSMEEKINNMSTQMTGFVTKPELEARSAELRLETSKIELQLLKAQMPFTPQATQNRR